jgi:putative ATPase
VPRHLRDASYATAARLGHGKGYQYPHNDPAGVLEQQYAPDSLVGRRYYLPTTHGAEARVTERSDRIRAILSGTADLSGTAESALASGGEQDVRKDAGGGGESRDAAGE